MRRIGYRDHRLQIAAAPYGTSASINGSAAHRCRISTNMRACTIEIEAKEIRINASISAGRFENAAAPERRGDHHDGVIDEIRGEVQRRASGRCSAAPSRSTGISSATAPQRALDPCAPRPPRRGTVDTAPVCQRRSLFAYQAPGRRVVDVASGREIPRPAGVGRIALSRTARGVIDLSITMWWIVAALRAAPRSDDQQDPRQT